MLLLKNGLVYTMETDEAINTDILIGDGKILKIAEDISCENAEEIDLSGKIVIPGLIDACSSIGLIEEGKKLEGDDINEKNELILSDLKTKDGIYIWDNGFNDALKNGVTTAVITSGKMNVIGSQSCAIKTKNSSLEEMLVKDFVDLHIVLGDSPKKWNQGKQETPLSRMGIISLLRRTLIEARDYLENKKNKNISYLEYNAKYEAFESVFNNKVPLKITAHKAQDILAAVNIGNEFNIRVVINYGTEAYLVREVLKKYNVPVLLGSCLTDKSSYDLINRKDSSGKILSDYGITTAVASNYPDVISSLLMISAGIYAKAGMSFINTLKSVTINPARILGLDDKIGSIKVGKDADIIVFDDNPIKSMANIVMTIIDGELTVC